MRSVSGGDAEIYAALLVELLRSVQVKRVASDGATETVWCDVTKRAILPGIRDRKYKTAVATHQDILLNIGHRSGRAFRLGFTGRARCALPPRRILLWRRIVGKFVIGNLGVVYRASIYYRWAQQKSAETEWKSAIESAESAATEAAVAADCSEVRIIKSQARNIRELWTIVESVVESKISVIVAMHGANAVSCAHHRRADAARALHSRLHANICV